LDKNTYEIRFCELISASLVIGEKKVLRIDGHCGPKVQRVQKVQKVQRVQRVQRVQKVVEAPAAPVLIKPR
jgi:hypothetical protein